MFTSAHQQLGGNTTNPLCDCYKLSTASVSRDVDDFKAYECALSPSPLQQPLGLDAAALRNQEPTLEEASSLKLLPTDAHTGQRT
jgi:hypothetical protein